ncbi:MAG: DNA-protecting protein DprA [Proteobacteria bacterium]|nr:DNA-protecting protein DprA [Pseudomonadota bacterium]
MRFNASRKRSDSPYATARSWTAPFAFAASYTARVQDLDEIRAWLVLLRAPGTGPAALRGLVGRAGSARIVREDARRLRRDSGLDADAWAWIESPDPARIEADLAWLDASTRRLLCFTDADFPPQFANIPQPPAALFVAGDCALLLRAQIAMVGARAASAQGLANARAFARALTLAGLVVTSGLADGIDGAAHAGALDAGGATIAVTGTGPDLVYPRKHRELADRIAARGAVVSEFPPGTPALPAHFPQRNRLIAALSLGTLVVEAGLQSGSLITARLAGEMGREVFALPGSIHNPLARGCHRLIRDGAHLTETADEVIEALAPAARALGEELRERLDAAADPSRESPRPAHGDDADYLRLLSVLDEAPLSMDELAARTGLKPAELSSMLLLLELEGRVAPAVSGGWQRLSRPS